MGPAFKLGCFFSVFVILFSLFGVIINSQFDNFSLLIEDLHDHPMAVMRSSSSAALDVVKISRNIKEALLIKNKAQRDRIIASLSIYETNIRRELKLVNARITGEEGSVLINNAFNSLKRWPPLKEKILVLVDKGNIDKAFELLRSEGNNLLSYIENSILKLTNFAVGQGMHYHALGIQTTTKARIILLVSGFIVVLLFIVVGFIIGRFLIKPEYTVKDYLVRVTKNDLNLSIPFNETLGGAMGKHLLKFIQMVKEHIDPAQDQIRDMQKNINSVLSYRQNFIKTSDALEQKTEYLDKKSLELVEKIHPVIDSVATFAANNKQIENDLKIVMQITSSQQLLLGTLKSAVDQEKLQQIKDQENSINNYIKSSVEIISQASVLSQNLKLSLKEISDLCTEKTSFKNDINDLRNSLQTIVDSLEKVRSDSVTVKKMLRYETKNGET
ncbi:MAG: MCP four helix bundle domain-containing protein [Myxococcales bacterium]|nr:MCP four helix bundle domain-containing protein [Myxococcales bacterium]USN51671.1 MAG: MCP four helix bundle domain-containing protein [Myxococcales bacterium]